MLLDMILEQKETPIVPLSVLSVRMAIDNKKKRKIFTVFFIILGLGFVGFVNQANAPKEPEQERPILNSRGPFIDPKVDAEPTFHKKDELQ